MGFVSILGFAHQLIEARLKPGEAAIDATAGNGVDTVFLARQVGAEGCVYAFDIQESALASTAARCAREVPDRQVELLHRSHAEMAAAIPEHWHGRIAAVTFNLGYLPGHDHSTITLPDSTLQALDSAAKLLRRGGVITIVVYSGHPGGETEAAAVDRWAAGLPQDGYQAMTYRFVNQRNHPPYVIAVEKR
ncbi:Putative rRNA methylase [Paenibacillus sp. UNCCL117]|uniref:class I SAM-dependent methyltransferase n=1 Tax=unclassified Paenibacillus TaxID=185978 RepID=UPI000890D1FD|nr:MULTISPECIES: class I SAM-dependent methyltransferase [unclassified Paenibacillus]SDE21714.1 Putative rRNA methylase [Paenibacillus sp. cl123]SFW43183.1 Putative rRNA methylase [Paenibacillus sp. UNCCL117]